MDAAKLALTTFFITLIPTRVLSKLYFANIESFFLRKHLPGIMTIMVFIAIFILIHHIFKKARIASRLPNNYKGEALLAISSYAVLLPEVMKLFSSVFGGGAGLYSIYGLAQPIAIIGFFVLIAAIARFFIALEPINVAGDNNSETQPQ